MFEIIFTQFTLIIIKHIIDPIERKFAVLYVQMTETTHAWAY